jgi:hypothetical protein
MSTVSNPSVDAGNSRFFPFSPIISPPAEWNGLSLAELETRRQALWEERASYEKKYKTLYTHTREIEGVMASLEEMAVGMEKYMYSREPETLEDVRVALMLIRKHLHANGKDAEVVRLVGSALEVVGRVEKGS